MEVVRRFIREQPNGVGAVLTGRARFFDSDKERRNALGIGDEFHELTLNEFNDEQIKRYLDKHRLSAVVPSWMPSRPLLVGYLASSGVLGQAASGGGSDLDLLSDPARGWDFVVDRVCSREAEIEAGIDGQTVRRMLERLATKARRGQSGVGPLSREDVIAAFAEICGYQPDKTAARRGPRAYPMEPPTVTMLRPTASLLLGRYLGQKGGAAPSGGSHRSPRRTKGGGINTSGKWMIAQDREEKENRIIPKISVLLMMPRSASLLNTRSGPPSS